MKELRWLREEPKSHAFFLFFFNHILILFLAEAEGQSNEYKNSM